MKNVKNISQGMALVCGLAAMTLSSTAGAQFRDPSIFQINKTRPRLVVLLHGVTPEVGQDPEAKIGQPGHARYYWGFDFIKGLQGRLDEDKMGVITPRINGSLRATNTTTHDWRPDTPDANAFDYAPICFPISGWGTIPASMQNNQTFIKDYIRLMTKAPGAQNTMVMINTRDGSKHFMHQLAETIEEVYASYTIAFGDLPEAQQPQIYLVTHSFGGIIARGILANPTQPDLFGRRLTGNQRRKCEYLRKRVVLVNTMAGPHTGTFIGDPASDVADYVSANGWGIIRAIMGNMLFAVASGEFLTEEELNNETRNALEGALNAIAGKRDCLEDLRRVPEYNAGILHPNTARRWDGGPMVPIYTAAGRNPGGRYFDDDRSVFYLGGVEWNPVDTIDLMKKAGRFGKEASLLNLISAVLHQEGYGREGGRPWGTATLAEGDRVSNPFEGTGPRTARGLAAGWGPNFLNLLTVGRHFLAGEPYGTKTGDGQWDDDGFLGWDSAQAIGIDAPNYYRLFDNQMYGTLLPWDIDNHGSMMFNAGNGAWIHNELIREAGPVVSSGARRSVWGNSDSPETPSNSIKVELLQVKDITGDIDYGDDELQVTVRIAGTSKTQDLPEGDNITSGIQPFYGYGMPTTVIPIRIQVKELDFPDPDDICTASIVPGQTSIYLFFDTRTNRIFGDVTGVEGETITITPNLWWQQHRVQTKIRITKVGLPV